MAAVSGHTEAGHDLERTVASRLFNSASAESQNGKHVAPIDVSDEPGPAIPHPAYFNDAAQAESHGEAEYPPTSARRQLAETTPSFIPRQHPQLLPNAQTSDTSPVTTTNSTTDSSNRSSFEPSRHGGAANSSSRLAVLHPNGYSGSPGYAAAGPQAGTSSSTGHQRDAIGATDYSNDEAGEQNGFVKIGANRRKSMQIFGTPQVGIIGIHKPRDLIRIDRDYSSGEICQFWSGFPFELEGRITATQHLNIMNDLNARLAAAFNPYKSIFDNVIAVLSLYLSTWLLSSHYDKQIAIFDTMVTEANHTLYNPAGLNLINPKKNGYLFLELEYY